MTAPGRLLPFGLCVPLLLAGCFDTFEDYRQLAPPARPAGARAVNQATPSAVFPLQPGARYDYRAHFGLGAAGPFFGRAAMSVVDAWQVGARETDEVRVSSSYFGRTREDPYTFAREAGWLGLFEKAPPDQLTRFMPTMLAVGSHWEVATGEGTGHARVEAIEPVRVPAGNFPTSWRVRYLNPAAKTEIVLWLVPHVGLARADVAMTVRVLPLRGRLELMRFEPPLAEK